MSAVLRIMIENGPDGATLRLQPPRAPDPALLLSGKTPERAMALVPLLFNLCPAAHRIAAALAMDLAVPAAWFRQLAQERLRQQAVTILRDWPVALSQPPRAEDFQGLSVLSPDRLGKLMLDLEIRGGGMIETVAGWSPAWGRTDLSLQDRLYDRLSGALDLCEQLRTGVFDTASGRSGTGTGWAQAARGRLFHTVRVADGRITAYTIDTPTDRMIRDGSLHDLLAAALDAPASVRERVFSLALTCADPCVEIELVRVKDFLHA